MSAKPSLPPVPAPGQPRARFDHAVRETLETIAGRKNNAIEPLPSTATLSDVIAKVNEIIALLQ